MPVAKVQSAAAVMTSGDIPPPVPPRVIEGTQPLPREQDEVEGTYISISEIQVPPQKKNGDAHSPLNPRRYTPPSEARHSHSRSSEYLEVLPMLQEQPTDPEFKLQSPPPERNGRDGSP